MLALGGDAIDAAIPDAYIIRFGGSTGHERAANEVNVGSGELSNINNVSSSGLISEHHGIVVFYGLCVLFMVVFVGVCLVYFVFGIAI